MTTALIIFKSFVRRILEKIIQRKVILLPEHNGSVAFYDDGLESLLPLQYTYRASPEGQISYKFQVDGKNLKYTLFTMSYPSNPKTQSGQLCLSANLPVLRRGDVLKISLTEGLAWQNDSEIELVRHEHLPARKFTAQMSLTSDGRKLSRFCSHYLRYDDKTIGKDYYFGDDYSNYPTQTNTLRALRLVSKYKKTGILLDVGCAMGIYTKAFREAGFNAYGIDISGYAIDEARILNSDQNSFYQCNMDKDEIPFDFTFDIFWMWDVLEHAANPFGMLEKVSRKAAPGAYMFVHTSNSESLTRFILGSDWEGYSDYSHYGVDEVSATNLTIWLYRLGWEIIIWKCDTIWVEGDDPTLQNLRYAFYKIPELATLLSERNLGDSILVVAKKL